MNLTLQEIARVLGGEMRGNQVFAPVLAPALTIGHTRLSCPTRPMDSSSLLMPPKTIISTARITSAKCWACRSGRRVQESVTL